MWWFWATVITFNLLATEAGQIAPGQMQGGIPGKCSWCPLSSPTCWPTASGLSPTADGCRETLPSASPSLNPNSASYIWQTIHLVV